MIGTMRLIPPHGLRNNADGRFICFILHKRGFEKKKILVKVSFCKGKITSNNLTKQMISQIFLNKSINRIHKKIQNSCLFLRAMKYTYLYIKLYYIKYNVLLKYRHINEIIVFAFQMKMLYQINKLFKLQPFLVKKKTVRKKAELHSNTNKCTI